MKKRLVLEIIGVILIGSYLFTNIYHSSQTQISHVVGVEKTIQSKQGVSEEKKAQDVANSDVKYMKTISKVKSIELEEEIESSVLVGKIISIDAGHQSHGNSAQEPIGPGSTKTKAKVSSGTRGVATGKYEYELNLEVALKLKKALVEKGMTVYMVRETNEVDISNKERAQLANDVKADLSLRIHADGSENSSVQGFSVLVPGGDFVSQEVSSQSYAIGECMENALSKGIPNKSRGIVVRKDLSGFNWSTVPAVLLEMGFMSNAEEDQRMSTETFQNDLVEAIVEALANYFKED